MIIFPHNSLSAHGAQGTTEAGVAAVAVQPGPVLLLAPRHAARVLAAARLRQTELPRARAPGLGAGAGVTAVHVGVLLTNQRSVFENDDKLEKKTENMINRSKVFRKNFENMCEKIDKIELSKFKKVTSDEIQKLINACKNEQKITK